MVLLFPFHHPGSEPAQALLTLIGHTDHVEILPALGKTAVYLLLAQPADANLIVYSRDGGYLLGAVKLFHAYPPLQFGTLPAVCQLQGVYQHVCLLV